MAKAKPFIIIKDTREQEGYSFEPSSSRYHTCKGMVTQKLDTGDYSIVGLEDKLCIERKASVVEFANNIGHDQARFMREIERMEKIPHRYMVFEFSLSDLMNFPEGSGIPESDWGKLKVTNRFMLKMIMEFQMKHGIHVMFCDSKKNAKWAVLSLIKRVNELYQ
jgi:ERCC4-type nuclease